MGLQDVSGEFETGDDMEWQEAEEFFAEKKGNPLFLYVINTITTFQSPPLTNRHVNPFKKYSQGSVSMQASIFLKMKMLEYLSKWITTKSSPKRNQNHYLLPDLLKTWSKR